MLRDRFCTHGFGFQLLYSSVEIQHSAVAGSQLSLALSKTGVYICSCLAMIGQRSCRKNYTDVILTLSTTKAEYLVVNTCGRYFSLAKLALIKLLDKLIATEKAFSRGKVT